MSEFHEFLYMSTQILYICVAQVFIFRDCVCFLVEIKTLFIDFDIHWIVGLVHNCLSQWRQQRIPSAWAVGPPTLCRAPQPNMVARSKVKARGEATLIIWAVTLLSPPLGIHHHEEHFVPVPDQLDPPLKTQKQKSMNHDVRNDVNQGVNLLG